MMPTMPTVSSGCVCHDCATTLLTMKLPVMFGWKTSSKEQWEKWQLWWENRVDMLPRHCW